MRTNQKKDSQKMSRWNMWPDEKKKTWPNGTRRQVKIADIHSGGNDTVVICEHADNPAEATVCFESANFIDSLLPKLKVGQERTIEFVVGRGPTGGSWKLL